MNKTRYCLLAFLLSQIVMLATGLEAINTNAQFCGNRESFNGVGVECLVVWE